MKRAFCILGFFFCGFFFFSGCDAASNLAGDWADNSPDKDNVSAAKPGMSSSDVLTKIGKAHEMREGEMMYVGWQEWVYPTGSIFLFRGAVRYVQVKPLTSKQLAVLKDKDKKYDLNLKVLEGDKGEGETAKKDSDNTPEGANGLWSLDGLTNKPDTTSPMTQGFMIPAAGMPNK